MLIPEYSPKEQDVIGAYRVYPAVQDMFAGFGMPMPDTEPKFDRPISPKENMKRILKGKTPYWLPYGGMNTEDIQCFHPRQVPDNYVSHLVLDGGDAACLYPSLVLNSSWFDLEWEFMPVAGGATVHPGTPKVPDMSEWEKYISIPDLNALDWDAMKNDNAEYLNTNKFNMLNILSGPWERLISLMDMENAAISLIDEEQQEGIHRFFDQYCDFFDDYIGRVADCCNIDGVLVHDDWGHQNGPFFSRQTAEQMLLPYLKRIVASCHKRDLIYEQHSCGRNETFIDLYIEAGVNLYCPQDINDFDLLLEKSKDSQLIVGVPIPMFDSDASPEQIRVAAEKWFDHYKCYHFISYELFPNQVFNSIIYELSRKEYAGKEESI